MTPADKIGLLEDLAEEIADLKVGCAAIPDSVPEPLTDFFQSKWNQQIELLERVVEVIDAMPDDVEILYQSLADASTD